MQFARDLVAEIDALVPDLDRHAPIVVVFAGRSYRALFENWLSFFRRYPRQLLVVTEDASAAGSARRNGYRSIVLPDIRDFGTLMMTRWRLMREVLSRGFEVLHCDVDAVWRRDPSAVIAGLPGDILFSQRHNPAAGESAGVCCGFLVARPSPQVLEFMQLVEDDMTATGDDEISCERVLRAIGFAGHLSDRLLAPIGPPDVARRGPVRAIPGLAVGILSKEIVRPVPPRALRFDMEAAAGRDALVFHPTGGSIADKIEALKTVRCWSDGDREERTAGWRPLDHADAER